MSAFHLHQPAAWTVHAACKQHPELSWFPGRGEDDRAARRVCYGCPVVDECREFALARNDTGIWGGMSEKQREAERRRRRREQRRTS